MSDQVREWLPIQAAVGPRVRDALERAVEEWSGKWFAGAGATLSSIEPEDEAKQLPGGWVRHGAVAVPADGPESLRLAGLALGADPENLVLSEPDRDIVGKLAATIHSDLAATLSAALGWRPAEARPSMPASAFPEEAGLVLHVSDARGRALARASIALSALVPFIKADIPQRPGPAIGRLHGAIGRATTRLDVRLGETLLSLGDLAGLAAGDVLVLDREIESGAVISVSAGERTPFARAELEPDDGSIRLILNHEPRDS